MSDNVTGLAADSLRSVQRLFGDWFELAGLEARLAGISIAAMLAMAIGAAVLAVTVWLALMAALVAWLVQNIGIDLYAALLWVAGANALAVIVLALFVRKASRNLAFKATRRALGIALTKGGVASAAEEGNR